MSEPIHVCFDMETQDPDDFLCLLFLASHPGVHLKAVTLVPGSQEQVGLVRWALAQLGAGEVAIGAHDITHAKPSVSPWHWRAFFSKGARPRSAVAEDAWRVLLRECDENTVLLTGGPLTNVAETIRRSVVSGRPFVAGCWLAQGGFAGDNIVPEHLRLPKFVGKTHMATFNFGAHLPAARASLAHEGFGCIRLVSKNVCHAESNRFGQQQLERLLGGLPDDELLGKTRGRSACGRDSGAEARHMAGLGLIAQGMREYMSGNRGGKLLHDPLAAACVIDGGVIAEWHAVELNEDTGHRWGSRSCPGSKTAISVRHDPDRFWAVFLGEVQASPSAAGALLAPPQPLVPRTMLSEGLAAMGTSNSQEAGRGDGTAPFMSELEQALATVTASNTRALHMLVAVADACERSATKSLHRQKADTRALLRAGGWPVLAALGCRSAADRIHLPAQPDARIRKVCAVVRCHAESLAQRGGPVQLRLSPWQQRANKRSTAAIATAAGAMEALEGAEAADAGLLQTIALELAPPSLKRRCSGHPEEAVEEGSSLWAAEWEDPGWEDSALQGFRQPSKPSRNEGLDALERLARAPNARPDRVLMQTHHVVVVYDVYPKARVHVLLLPRDETLRGPDALRAEHAPLLRHMAHLAAWLAPQLRALHPGLPPLRCGFHAVPSMSHLHLHLLSLDFASPELKRPRHWTIFNTDYLVPPAAWAEQLERHGRVCVDHKAEKAKVDGEMRCPLLGERLADMAAVRLHLSSARYQERLRDIQSDIVYM